MMNEKLIQERIEAATVKLKSEVEYWKKVATDRLLSFFKNIKPQSVDDIFVFTIPIGNMPADQIAAYVKEHADNFKNSATNDGKFAVRETFWLPIRDDGVGPTIELLSPKQDDIIIFHIPVGNMREGDARDMVEGISKNINITNHKIGDALFLPERNSDRTRLEMVSKEEAVGRGLMS